MGFIGIAIFLGVLVCFGIAIYLGVNSNEQSAVEIAGRRGEIIATRLIRETMCEGDILLTNVNLCFDGKRTELDNVVINDRGISIIEVKNYSGRLVGGEYDSEWIKSKVTEGGNIYQKTVRNPIKQVKRQEYILANYLREYGIKVWVNGYAYLVERNSPVNSAYILNNKSEIDNAIHFGQSGRLSVATMNKIVQLLS